MSDSPNPYATPTAPLGDRSSAPFFATSTFKLAALSTATLGLYEVWWSYQSWKAIRARTGRKMLPWARALFAPLWSFALFGELEREAVAAAERSGVLPVLHGTAYLVLSALWRLPDPYWLVTLLAFLPLLPANSLARRLNARLAPEAEASVPWSVANTVTLAIGGVILALAVIGTFMPEESD